jgi:beta-glucosidase
VVSTEVLKLSKARSVVRLPALRRHRVIARSAVALVTIVLVNAPATYGSAADTKAACPWVGSAASPEERAAQVLAQMTLDEKLSMTHGTQLPGYAGVIAPIPRLCIPALNLNDGGAGVVMDGSTAMPAPIAAAATFDRSVGQAYGTVVGEEARTKGVSVNLGPDINLVRDPRGGRVFEMAGEDPYLAGAMATTYVQGVQSQGVMTDLKHLVANDTEQNRNNANAIVDERTLNEIYFPPFKQAVQQGRAASIMAATSLVNGVHANENAYLLAQTAKQDWGLDGFVVTDWDQARSTVRAANAQLDLNMPAPGNFGQSLTDAVRAGKVSIAVLTTRSLAYSPRSSSTACSTARPARLARWPPHRPTCRRLARSRPRARSC